MLGPASCKSALSGGAATSYPLPPIFVEAEIGPVEVFYRIRAQQKIVSGGREEGSSLSNRMDVFLCLLGQNHPRNWNRQILLGPDKRPVLMIVNNFDFVPDVPLQS